MASTRAITEARLPPDGWSTGSARGTLERSPLRHGGFSGAQLSTLTEPNSTTWVVKRTSWALDWIRRATDDVGCREAEVARHHRILGDAGVEVTARGTERVGLDDYVLMADLRGHMLSRTRLRDRDLTAVLTAAHRLHSLSPSILPLACFCPPMRRLRLLRPTTMRHSTVAVPAPLAARIQRGWERFDALAPTSLRELFDSLDADDARLMALLSVMKPALLHGDLKMDNVGRLAGRIAFIDWAMVTVASVSVELGWFVAANSRALPISPAAVLERYAVLAGIDGAERGRFVALAALFGLYLRGWQKALDHEGGSTEIEWWLAAVSAGDAPW